MAYVENQPEPGGTRSVENFATFLNEAGPGTCPADKLDGADSRHPVSLCQNRPRHPRRPAINAQGYLSSRTLILSSKITDLILGTARLRDELESD